MNAKKNWMKEIKEGERFEFGKNWQNFLALINEERIDQAKESIKDLLGFDDLKDKSFLDIGCGSGLFSLAAKQLGARVVSFDFDHKSVNCTLELKRRYFPHDSQWEIFEGSVIDQKFINNFGKFDIVYSWGVLHHTGDMWKALEYASNQVKNNGCIALALYNDQGGASRRWLKVKKIYNKLPNPLKGIFAIFIYIPREIKSILIHLIRNEIRNYINYINKYSIKSKRGMSWWHDRIDWIGGYPFEVSKPEEIFSFFKKKGYKLSYLKTCGGGLGCNEYMFEKSS